MTANKATSHSYMLAVMRSCAALFGGYIASFVVVFAVARVMLRFGSSAVDAAAAPAIASFLLWLTLALYAFGARSALRAWLLPLLLIAVFGGIAALLGMPIAAASIAEPAS